MPGLLSENDPNNTLLEAGTVVPIPDGSETAQFLLDGRRLARVLVDIPRVYLGISLHPSVGKSGLASLLLWVQVLPSLLHYL